MNTQDSEFLKALFDDFGFDERPEQNLLDTDFLNIGHAHDWRNHVPAFLRGGEEWKNLTHRERCIIYCNAERNAEKEEWE